MLTQFMPSSFTCPSICMCVCVSVTLRYCVKTAKRRITQIVVAEFVVAEFLLTSASRGPSAIAEFLVFIVVLVALLNPVSYTHLTLPTIYSV